MSIKEYGFGSSTQVNNPHILTGIEAVINLDNVKSGYNLKELEKQMINGGIITEKVKDNTSDKFMEELRMASQRLGISLGTDEQNKKADDSRGQDIDYRKPDTEYKQSSSSNHRLDTEYRKSDTESYKPPQDYHRPLKEIPRPAIEYQRPAEDYQTESNESQQSDEEDNSDVTNQANEFISKSSREYNQSAYYNSPSSSKASLSMEQRRREHIESILNNDEDNEVELYSDKEREEDLKAHMLDEIDLLINTLKEEDINLGEIPTLDMSSDFDDIKRLLDKLRYKNDHVRYCSMAEELILFGAHRLEDLFNGERTWFGRYQPDLTGWHRQVNTKLRRMRYDTGQIVSTSMESMNIGPTARIFLELVPNMFLYSNMMKEKKLKEKKQNK